MAELKSRKEYLEALTEDTDRTIMIPANINLLDLDITKDILLKLVNDIRRLKHLKLLENLDEIGLPSKINLEKLCIGTLSFGETPFRGVLIYHNPQVLKKLTYSEPVEINKGHEYLSLLPVEKGDIVNKMMRYFNLIKKD